MNEKNIITQNKVTIQTENSSSLSFGSFTSILNVFEKNDSKDEIWYFYRSFINYFFILNKNTNGYLFLRNLVVLLWYIVNLIWKFGFHFIGF